jgi:hypothetical protein
LRGGFGEREGFEFGVAGSDPPFGGRGMGHPSARIESLLRKNSPRKTHFVEG